MTRRWVNAVVAAAALGTALGAAGAEGAAPGEAPRLELLARALVLLKDGYVDPARLAPRRLLVAALARVAERVDALTVEGDERGERLTLRMGEETRELDLGPVKTIFALRPAMVDALGFVLSHGGVDPRAVELAAIEGLASTLGPGNQLLTPQAAQELRTQLRGDLGALGLVLGLRDGRVTVASVLPGSPAERIGVTRGDVITELGGRSTGDRELRQIVDWMRGPVGSEVAVAWTHAGRPRRATARRERVQVPNVTARALLAERVAYVRLPTFGPQTARDLRAALRSLRGGDGEPGAELEPLRGVIVDVRDDRGGLFGEAVSVADVFLSGGEIVRTAASSRRDEVKRATASAEDVTAPVVVLVSGTTAGAPELVAAALRENGRAILVGQRTLGLGGVQVVQDLEDPAPGAQPAALELTIAQRLAPGGRPYDGVGLVPDVVVRAGVVRKDRAQFFAPRGAPRAPPAGEPGPLGTFTYLADDDALAEAADAEDAAAVDAGDLAPSRDRAVIFAADILARAEAPDRDGLRAAASALLPDWQAAEEERLARRLARLGVDWRRTPSATSPHVKVTTSVLPRRVSAAEPVAWTVTVENPGPAALSRLRAWTVAPGASGLDGLELLFGAVPPGGKRSATVQLPGHALAVGAEPIAVHFEEGNGHAPADVATRLEVASLVRPSLSARLQLACGGARCGPGAGHLEAGVELKLQAAVRNGGPGPTGAGATVALRSADERVYARETRAPAGPLAPGAERKVALGLRLVAGSGEDAVPARIELADASRTVTSCDLRLKRGDRLPIVRDCQPVHLRLTPDPDAAPLTTDGDRFTLSGDASIAGGGRLRSVAVWVGDRKVFSRAAAGEVASLDFTADLALQPGANAVTLRAEASDGQGAVRSFRIERR